MSTTSSAETEEGERRARRAGSFTYLAGKNSAYADKQMLGEVLPAIEALWPIFSTEAGIVAAVGATAELPAPSLLHACKVSYMYWSAGEKKGDAGVAGFAASLVSDPSSNNPNGEAAAWTASSDLAQCRVAFLTGRRDALKELGGGQE